MDREKVISTFEKIISVCKEDGCDFVDLTFEDADQILALLNEQQEQIDRLIEENASNAEMADGLKELLKEQEPIMIKTVMINGSGRNGRCQNCLMMLNEMDYPNYCGFCGQAVKWE